MELSIDARSTLSVVRPKAAPRGTKALAFASQTSVVLLLGRLVRRPEASK
jgi:hypothetical protein